MNGKKEFYLCRYMESLSLMMLSSPLYSYTVLALFWLTRAMEYIVTKPVAWLFLTIAQSPQGRYHIVNRLTGGWK
ncbi:hypothetical protein DMW53_08505 [Serratia marcescens]|nr:hypothetical protein DMW53_08505 [Serratia marcescens]PYB19774.1 hypothetical protein DMW55_06215 [Serratia marcescens]